MQSHTDCICLTFLHCVFKCFLKLPFWEDAYSHRLHLFGFSSLWSLIPRQGCCSRLTCYVGPALLWLGDASHSQARLFQIGLRANQGINCSWEVKGYFKAWCPAFGLITRRRLPKTLKLYLNNTNNLLSDAAGISKPISLWSSQCEQISQIFKLKYWLSVTYCVKVSFFTITSKPNMAIPQNRPQKARNLSPVAPSPVMRDHPGLGPSAL